MAKKVSPTTIPLEEKIKAYYREFELFAKYKQRLEDKSWQVRQAASMEAAAEGWQGGHWNWDEAWDEPLVEAVKKLAAEGFTVHKFYRKRKIDFTAPKGYTRRRALIAICDAIGEDWTGVSFSKARGSVWWKGGGPSKAYRI